MLYDSGWNREELDYKALENQWHVVARSEDVSAERPTAVRLLGEDLVLWRDGSGGIHAWKDYCGHRGARLSLGCVKKGEIECPYHGWRYDGQGDCTLVPAHPDRHAPASDRLIFKHYAEERYGYVWASLVRPDGHCPSCHSGTMTVFARSMPGLITTRPMRCGRWKTSSMPRIFLSCTPTSTACRTHRSR